MINLYKNNASSFIRTNIFLHYLLIPSIHIGEELAYKLLSCSNDLASLEDCIEQEKDQKDQGQNKVNETSKKTFKIPGKRGRKANINHKENFSLTGANKRFTSFDNQETTNSCANNTRSKCRKSRSGRSIRNSTRLSSLNYNDDGENNENGLDENSVDNLKQQSIIRTRRSKQTKLDNDQDNLINDTICLPSSTKEMKNKKITMTNQNSMYLKKNDDEIKLDEQMNDQLQFNDLNNQGQFDTNSTQHHNTIVNTKQTNELSNSNLYKCINLSTHSTIQHPVSNEKYIIDNETNNSIHFMQQMHGYSLSNDSNNITNKPTDQQHYTNTLNELNEKIIVGGTFNTCTKNATTSFMQGLNESHQNHTGNDAIMSTENRIDNQISVKENNEEYDEEDLDEIQRASMILDDNNNSMQQHKNTVLYNNRGLSSGMTTINTINNLQQSSSNNNSTIYNQTASSCCSTNSINSTQQQTSSFHQMINNKCEQTSAKTLNDYSICCPIQSTVFNQCMNRSNLEHRTLDRLNCNSGCSSSTSFTSQSNPLLASTSSADSSSTTSLTSMSPVQIGNCGGTNCSKINNENRSVSNNQAMLQVLTNSNSTIELMDGLNTLNGQSPHTLIHYSNLSHLNKPSSNSLSNNTNYSNGMRDHHQQTEGHLIVQNQSLLMTQQSTNNQMNNNQQIGLMSNNDHLYHNNLDPNEICSSDCADLLEQYQLEPINNLLNSSKKTSFAEFDEQLENENNLNNINASANFNLDAEKDVVYLLSSNNQNVSLLF